MNLLFAFVRRRKLHTRRRASPRREPEMVFRAFVRALERLSHAPPGGAPANIGAMRDKA